MGPNELKAHDSHVTGRRASCDLMEALMMDADMKHWITKTREKGLGGNPELILRDHTSATY